MTKIINLTQHAPAREQAEAGVFEPADKQRVRELLNFNELPNKEAINERAEKLASIAESMGAKKALIGGAPYLMAPLEKALKAKGIAPLYAFSKRVSVEAQLPDGSVEKKIIFRHEGFIEA